MPTLKHLYVVRMIAAFLFLPYEHVGGFPEFAVNDVDRILKAATQFPRTMPQKALMEDTRNK